jgi:hypothetical protein
MAGRKRWKMYVSYLFDALPNLLLETLIPF